MNNKYKVKYLLKSKGRTVGAEIIDISNRTSLKVPKEKFIYYKGKLENAIVTIDGVIRGKNIILPVKDINDSDLYNNSEELKNLSKVKHYTIMYEDIKVLEYNMSTDTVVVLNRDYLPFGLRNKDNITSALVYKWISERINNIHRTYMNMVYIARKVGRDKQKVLKDSAGVSFTDNFWIKTSDVSTTWDELKKLRDDNIALSTLALTGQANPNSDLMKGITSLFTTKGCFAKAIIGGYMYKRIEDAELEYPAYLIGKQLGISVSECSIANNYVKIKLFTDYNTSLVHASELKDYFNTSEEIYNDFSKMGRKDIMLQLQRMYIFNYIIGNSDLHDDNYGVLYDAKTFEFKSLAPCFDHNVAFQRGFNGLSRTTMGNSASAPLDDWTALFIHNHPDIVKGLKSIDLNAISKCLDKIQFEELKERIQNVISWAN